MRPTRFDAPRDPLVGSPAMATPKKPRTKRSALSTATPADRWRAASNEDRKREYNSITMLPGSWKMGSRMGGPGGRSRLLELGLHVLALLRGEDIPSGKDSEGHVALEAEAREELRKAGIEWPQEKR
jgi:hypothetical protein